MYFNQVISTWHMAPLFVHKNYAAATILLLIPLSLINLKGTIDSDELKQSFLITFGLMLSVFLTSLRGKSDLNDYQILLLVGIFHFGIWHLLFRLFSGRLIHTIYNWIILISAVNIIVILSTRGVWIAGFTMALVAVSHFILSKNTKLRNYTLLALVLLLFGIFSVTAIGGGKGVFDNGTIHSRFHYWNASIEMFLDNPVSGVGGGQWKIEYPATGLKGN